MWVIVAFTLTANLFVMSHVYDTRAECGAALGAGLIRDAAQVNHKRMVRSAQCVEVIQQ
jgi:hypothetical protein